jgi:hypothetical protein
VARSRILASLGLGRHEELLHITRPSFERYAARHGYELCIPFDDPAPERAHKQWAKVALIRRLLPQCDTLVWVDSDAVVVDDSVDIAHAIGRSPRRFLGLVEHRYDGQLVPNTGVMVIRSCRSSQRFFDAVWDKNQYLETRWHDNAAVLELMGYEFDPEASPMYCRPGRPTRWGRRVEFMDIEWNSVPCHMAASPRIFHVTGATPWEERRARLQVAADAARTRVDGRHSGVTIAGRHGGGVSRQSP